MLTSSALFAVETKDAQGQLLATNDFSLFIRGLGGFGGPAQSPKIKVQSVHACSIPLCIHAASLFACVQLSPLSAHMQKLVATPSIKPDVVVRETTVSGIAAVYRLNGDVNPLHIDPAMAKVQSLGKRSLTSIKMLHYSHILLGFVAGFMAGFVASGLLAGLLQQRRVGGGL